MTLAAVAFALMSPGFVQTAPAMAIVDNTPPTLSIAATNYRLWPYSGTFLVRECSPFFTLSDLTQPGMGGALGPDALALRRNGGPLEVYGPSSPESAHFVSVGLGRLPEGMNTIEWWGRDIAGNASSGSITFDVDSIWPAFSLASSPTATWSGTDVRLAWTRPQEANLAGYEVRWVRADKPLAPYQWWGVDETYTQLDPNALPVNSVKLGPTEPLWIHKGAGSGPIQYWIQAIDRHGSTSKEEYVASVGRRMETSLVEYPRPATLSAPAATCVLTGRLIGDGSPLGGRKVVLDGGTSETNLVANLMTTVTGADGSFSFAVRPTAKTYYQSRFEGDETGTPVTGISSCVTPKVILTRSTSWSTLRRRRAYYAKGFIQPAHSRGDLNKVRIYAYRKGRDGAYHYVKSFSASYSPYSSTKTRYSARVILGQRGAWKLVAYHAADTRHAATSGSADYLTVK